MVKDAPHITLTMGRDVDGEKTTGDIGTLGLGFGIFQAWLYMAVFSVIRIFEPSDFTGFNFYLTESMSNTILYTFLASSAITLIFIGASNQHYLRFYVSKLAMWLGASLCSVGTLIAFLACVPYTPESALTMGSALTDTVSLDPLLLENTVSPFDPTTPLSLFASLASGACMGIGSSLLVALWGTGFARSKFTTIVLNAAFSIPLGVIVAFLLTIWMPSPIAGIVTACLPFLAILFLQILTPMPFYQRHEKPIFDPFPEHRISYIVRIGIPTVIMGIALGALRIICVGEVLPSGSITIQLILGAACAMSIIVFVTAIALSRRNPYWDTLFRDIVPIIVIGSVSIPFIVSEYAVPSAFLVSLGYICLEVLMWVFFADLSNRFSLSPLFVFGLGRGILEIAGIFGSALALWAFHDSYMDIGGLTLLALICAALMSVGYSVLPRYREFKGIIIENGDPGASTAHPVVEARSAQNFTQASHENQMPLHDNNLQECNGKDTEELASKDQSGSSTTSATTDHSRYLASDSDLALSESISEAVVYESVDLHTMDADEPLLAVDGVAEEGDQPSPDSIAPAQQSVTPPGTDTIIARAGEENDGESIHERGSFYRRCDEISQRYMLSKRECEVLPLLAKGHNAAFIQEKLCVSKSTAKTHINHIYKKLDIHTQQELLNMVEDRQRGPKSGEEGDAHFAGLTSNASSLLSDPSDSSHASRRNQTHTGHAGESSRQGAERPFGNNYMLDKNAFEKAVNEAASRPVKSRPKAKRGYRTSIFKD